MNPARTRALALALTAVPSITDSDDETRFAFFLRDLLADWPYFKVHPERIRLVRTVDDARERYALLASAGTAGRTGDTVPTIILTGHYDVVSVENYGALASSAFDPDALSPRLVEALEAEAAAVDSRGGLYGDALRRALADLRSGEFLPGRGLLDMKAGLAAGLALLEEKASSLYFAETNAVSVNSEKPNEPGDDGALVFLAVPDEEGSSHGMLGAVRSLSEILTGWGLRAVAAINLDAAVDQGDGSAGRSVFLGSVGKLHPFALFVGRPTHAGAPFDGVNPALPAAEFARGIECAVGLFDRGQHAVESATTGIQPPPPPTILYYRELRDHYDVTTPSAVFVSVNVLTHIDGPGEVLAAVSSLAAASLEAAGAALRSRAAAYSSAAGQAFAPPDREPRVVSWAELERLARQADPASYEAAAERARAAEDRMAALAAFVAAAVSLAGLEGPAAIVGLAPPYYPRASLDPVKDAWLMAAIESAVSAMNRHRSTDISIQRFFPGISDMSFLNPGDSPEARRLAGAACPSGLDPLPAGFSCPVVNIGPWGREYHQRLERVHAGYAFEVLPELLERVVAEIFSVNVEN